MKLFEKAMAAYNKSILSMLPVGRIGDASLCEMLAAANTSAIEESRGNTVGRDAAYIIRQEMRSRDAEHRALLDLLSDREETIGEMFLAFHRLLFVQDAADKRNARCTLEYEIERRLRLLTVLRRALDNDRDRAEDNQ